MPLQCVDMGSSADVSEVNTVSIFRIGVKMGECLYKILGSHISDYRALNTRTCIYEFWPKRPAS